MNRIAIVFAPLDRCTRQVLFYQSGTLPSLPPLSEFTYLCLRTDDGDKSAVFFSLIRAVTCIITIFYTLYIRNNLYLAYFYKKTGIATVYFMA